MQINLNTQSSRTLKAKFEGFCRKCNQSYLAGTEIKNEDGKWVHSSCPSAVEIDEPVTPKKIIIPSPHQQALWDYIQDPFGRHAACIAKAGSGKTYTIVKAMEFTPKDAKVAFVAFGNRNAADIEKKAPKWATVCTLHSLGRRAVVAAFPEIQQDEYKMDTVLDYFGEFKLDGLFGEDKSIMKAKREMMADLASLAMNTGINETNREAIEDLVLRYGKDLGAQHNVLMAMLPKVVKLNFEMTNLMSFDDMITMPVRLGLPCEQYDFLFIDECQDLNDVQIKLALLSVKPDGRITAVGDPNQSMYGFRGADTQAVERIITSLNARVFPLSVTYRCPKSHVELARQIVPDLEAAPDAKEGLIKVIDVEKFSIEVQPKDMVICRTNAPLVGPAFDLIRHGIKAVIIGRDIGSGLLKLHESFKATSIEQAEEKLLKFRENEINRLSRRPHTETQIQGVEDKVATLQAIYDECDLPEQVAIKINQIFAKESDGVTFSSVHRAKGLESERVFIFSPELLPLRRKGMQEWEYEQELNIQYVAYTRSKNELIFVRSQK